VLPALSDHHLFALCTHLGCWPYVCCALADYRHDIRRLSGMGGMGHWLRMHPRSGCPRLPSQTLMRDASCRLAAPRITEEVRDQTHTQLGVPQWSALNLSAYRPGAHECIFAASVCVISNDVDCACVYFVIFSCNTGWYSRFSHKDSSMGHNGYRQSSPIVILESDESDWESEYETPHNTSECSSTMSTQPIKRPPLPDP